MTKTLSGLVTETDFNNQTIILEDSTIVVCCTFINCIIKTKNETSDNPPQMKYCEFYRCIMDSLID